MAWLQKGWVALASLALNMFLIGTLVPTFFQRERPMLMLHHGFGPAPMDMMRHWTPALSDADRDILCEALRPAGNQFAALKQAMEDSVRRSSEALRAEPFDPAAFKGALEPALEARTRFEQQQIDALAGAAARMSRDGRLTLLPQRVAFRGPGPGPEDGPMAGPGPGMGIGGPGRPPMPGPGGDAFRLAPPCR
jgi:uncharacterized membrane protein